MPDTKLRQIRGQAVAATLRDLGVRGILVTMAEVDTFG